MAHASAKKVLILTTKELEEFLNEMKFESNNMVIVDRGRKLEERSAILIESGIYKGYCFFDLNYQVNNIEVLKNILIQCKTIVIHEI
jgi:DNA polymerase-3 subunit epsilon